MNREEAIRAMLNGKKVRHYNGYVYYNASSDKPFVYHSNITGLEEFVNIPNNKSWTLFREPTERIMTRHEALAFCRYNKVVVRYNKGDWGLFSGFINFDSQVESYEYAFIDEDGTIGPPQKFTKRG